jgi:hypothetical protein
MGKKRKVEVRFNMCEDPNLTNLSSSSPLESSKETNFSLEYSHAHNKISSKSHDGVRSSPSGKPNQVTSDLNVIN